MKSGAQRITTDAWCSVRCLFRHGNGSTAEKGFEERITLWQATSAEEALALAEAEARDYAAEAGASSEYLGLAQSYALVGEVGHGAEVFSLIRTSELQPGAYLDHFFDTGAERQSEAE